MSNWQYANQVPTEKWRNAMTIPKELGLKQVNGKILLTSHPVRELAGIVRSPVVVNSNLLTGRDLKLVLYQFILKFNINKINDYSVISQMTWERNDYWI